jgi:hypothetical protein
MIRQDPLSTITARSRRPAIAGQFPEFDWPFPAASSISSPIENPQRKDPAGSRIASAGQGLPSLPAGSGLPFTIASPDSQLRMRAVSSSPAPSVPAKGSVFRKAPLQNRNHPAPFPFQVSSRRPGEIQTKMVGFHILADARV